MNRKIKFGGCLTLSVDLAKSNSFYNFYHKMQYILNSKSISKGNEAIVKWRIMENMSKNMNRNSGTPYIVNEY